jgi:hypothetical protein
MDSSDSAREQWQTLVNTVMNLPDPKKELYETSTMPKMRIQWKYSF